MRFLRSAASPRGSTRRRRLVIERARRRQRDRRAARRGHRGRARAGRLAAPAPSGGADARRCSAGDLAIAPHRAVAVVGRLFDRERLQGVGDQVVPAALRRLRSPSRRRPPAGRWRASSPRRAAADIPRPLRAATRSRAARDRRDVVRLRPGPDEAAGVPGRAVAADAGAAADAAAALPAASWCRQG